MRNQHRFLARIVIETQTPITIGSGNKGMKTDSLVLRDVNGLPFIPGTTLAGLLRHSLGTEAERDLLMGSQECGSPLIITEARMLDKDGKVLDGIIADSSIDTEFATLYRRQQPIRQHACIGHRGVTEEGGKFDEEVVVKGTRFCFEIEMLSDSKDDGRFKALLDTFASDTFRIGSGSRSGYGKIKVVMGDQENKCQYKNLDLTAEKDWYLKKSSSLSVEWKDAEVYELKPSQDQAWTRYQLTGLKPVDFLLFGSGLGNEKADMTFVRESYVKWTGNKEEVVHGTDLNPDGSEAKVNVVVIPASSVKGALAHRTAFHYNRLSGAVVEADGTIRNGKTPGEVTGNSNPAVKAIFGSEGTKEGNTLKDKQRGNILMSDIMRKADASTKPKLLNHVAIDRFTGGAIDGALFSEQALHAANERFEFEIFVHQDAFREPHVRDAFECALKDICTGLLPLGGGVNRGNGCFENGELKRDGIRIYGNN